MDYRWWCLRLSALVCHIGIAPLSSSPHFFSRLLEASDPSTQAVYQCCLEIPPPPPHAISGVPPLALDLGVSESIPLQLQRRRDPLISGLVLVSCRRVHCVVIVLSYIYHHIICSSQCVVAMLWAVVQQRRRQIRMVVCVVMCVVDMTV